MVNDSQRSVLWISHYCSRRSFIIFEDLKYEHRSNCWSDVCVPVAQWLEHCVSSAKVVGSIPREHMYWQKKICIASMHCKSLWIKASAKCINVNVFQGTEKTVGFSTCFQFVISIIRCSGLRSKPYVKYIFYFSAKWLSSSEGNGPWQWLWTIPHWPV